MSVGWIKERKHGLSNEDGLLLLTLLRKHEVDHKYQETVKVLKRTEVWKKNEQVQQWLQSKWLSIPQVCIL